MTEAQLFQYANTTALLSWVILILMPRRAAPVLRVVVPVGMALLYIWALTTAPANPDGGFGSLAQVKALFTQDRAVLAGWVHYLAFDLFVGCWMVLDAPGHRLHHLLVVPCLLLTFMFGPAGLLLYFLLRAVVRGRHGEQRVPA